FSEACFPEHRGAEPHLARGEACGPAPTHVAVIFLSLENSCQRLTGEPPTRALSRNQPDTNRPRRCCRPRRAGLGAHQEKREARSGPPVVSCWARRGRSGGPE